MAAASAASHATTSSWGFGSSAADDVIMDLDTNPWFLAFEKTRSRVRWLPCT